MRRVLVAVLAFVVPVLAGCTEDNPGLIVIGNVQPDAMCVYRPAAGSLVARGVYDVAFPHGYYVAPLFNSWLVSRTMIRPIPPMVETNGIQIEGAEVELTAQDGSALPIATSAYTVAASAFVPPALGIAPGAGTGLVEAIPASVGTELAGALGSGTTTITARITFFGRTAGGSVIDASPWLWPIEVCTGCLEAPCGTMFEAQCNVGQDGSRYTSASCPAL
jgi:hypothetical protein